MIVRVAKDRSNPYALIHNGILNDVRLSWKARGVAAYLLSKPDDWRITHKAIAAAGPDGARAVLSAMKELEDAGYLHRSRQQREDGRWESFVTLFEVPTPSCENAHPVPSARKPTLGEPSFGEPTLGKRAPLLSTEDKVLTQSTDVPSTETTTTDAENSDRQERHLGSGGGGGGGPLTTLPEDITLIWFKEFGQPSPEELFKIEQHVTSYGAGAYLRALNIAAANRAKGIAIKYPIAYVEGIAADLPAERRQGETDNESRRRQYTL